VDSAVIAVIVSGYSGYSGVSGFSGTSGFSGVSGYSGFSGYSGYSGVSGIKGDRYATMSSTANNITTGAETFTVDTGLAYSIGQTVIIAYDVTHRMQGDITAYNSGTGQLDVNITSTTGSGSGLTPWQINLLGAPGPAGASGYSGFSGYSGYSGTGATGSSGYSGFSGFSGTSSIAYSATFDATTSWGSPSGGEYTITFSHNLNSHNIAVTVWDELNNYFALPKIVKIDANSVKIVVSQTPDNRFSGRIVINGSAASGYSGFSGATGPAGPDMGIAIVYDGGGSVITSTGTTIYRTVTSNCTIQSYTVLADTSGTITLTLKKSTYSGFPSTSDITGGNNIVLSGPAQKSQDLVLSGWSTSLTAGDVLEFAVTGTPTNVKRVSVTLAVG
jgi:uncharacterized protein YdeI (BOF family)